MEGGRKGELLLLSYSDFKDFTGFIKAAFILWKLNVTKAVINAAAPPIRKVVKLISILYANPCNHLSMAYRQAAKQSQLRSIPVL